MAKGDITKKLDDLGIDAICEMIESDMFITNISQEIGVSPQALRNWINADDVRAARARDSLLNTAHECDKKALSALEQIEDDGSPAQVVRQREIASHYRWRAKVRNPQIYGDKISQEHSGGVTINVVTGIDE